MMGILSNLWEFFINSNKIHMEKIWKNCLRIISHENLKIFIGFFSNLKLFELFSLWIVF